ncbi:LOW QUALITY PROTEIN: 33 kDa ribonucleoprotein, chloroplastic-like [Curcuma longa]|uniref:LOW QUALITY PROTEIN: 33 kDa ribonucleoprotein, chloroplastic-like n=1 Tax=Curcuma longa TaxID=136217 RepID=UPI003D9ED7DE
MITAACLRCSVNGLSALSSHSLPQNHRRRHPSRRHPLPLPRLSRHSIRLETILFPLASLSFFPSPPHISASAAAAASYSSDEEDYEELLEEEEEEEQEQVLSKSSANSRSGSLPQDVGRLYVGNLPYSMTADQLAEIFREAGTVDAVEVVYDRVTDRSRGFAFVTMASVGEAEEAIRMFDGSLAGGRKVKVNFPEVPRGAEREVLGQRMRSRGYVDSPHKVYAGNLGWNLTSQALRDAFASQPGLLGAKVIFDRNTGLSRGFGFVTFASDEDCQAAIEAMNAVEVEGRPLRLSVAQGRRPSISISEESGGEEEHQGSPSEPSLSY